jgi:hypothetical protein
MDYSSMNCPCEDCLVISMCKSRVVLRKIVTLERYLIVEHIEKCPYIQEFFGHYKDGRIIHTHKKIYSVCEALGAPDHNFLWRENELW